MKANFFLASRKDKKATVKVSDLNISRPLRDGTEIVVRVKNRGQIDAFTGKVSRGGTTVYGAWLAHLPPVGLVKEGGVVSLEVAAIEIRG